jgi:23S rRNA (pseudouridine1915-N3)-methyltransferase
MKNNNINVYWIGKEENDDYSKIEKHYLKLSSRFASISQTALINKEILKKQSLNNNQDEVQKSYESIFSNKISNQNYSIILDPRGKNINTEKFADIFDKNSNIDFFIGGAYGFNDSFRKKANLLLGLSSLTLSHKIAKVVLFEQIYRALTINANHPYHK